MSSSGCEAMPIDSPSSIQSDSPSEWVRSQNEMTISPNRITAGSTKLDGSDRTRGRGRMREATEANPAILVSAPAAHGEDCGFCGLPITSSGASLVATLPAVPEVGAHGLAFG